MKLEQLTEGTIISFIVHINGEEVTFPSSIQEVYPKKHFIIADPVFQNDRIVTFKGDNITVDMLAIFEDDKPQLFENIIITAMKKADKSFCYTVVATSDSKAVNRRENFRCYVGCRTSVKRGIETAVYEGILRDVSMTGFALTLDSDLGFEQGQVLHAMLEDYIEELDENFSFHLYGFIVRIQKLDNGKIVYGCRMSTRVGGLENYVMKKERARLKKASGNNKR
ncbi:MAG: PilZ domain-containing protein [Lachnospiraceae bacterium]|nr:PilZ domain-containing protein [Lachnospiraceae bacterium]